MNDTQEMRLMELATKSVEQYNKLLDEKSRQIQIMTDYYDKTIERQRKETLELCKDMLSTYKDKSDKIIIDCSDNTDSKREYLTKGLYHEKRTQKKEDSS